MLTTVLIILLILALFGGGYAGGPAYSGYGYGFGTVALIALVVLLVSGRL